MWKVFAKDLHEALASRRAWLVMLALPLVLVALAGDLSTRAGALRTYIESVHEARADAERLRAILEDLDGVQLVDADVGGRPIWQFMDEERLDLALIWRELPGDPESGAWYLYAKPLKADDDRSLTILTLLTQAGTGLGRAWWLSALDSSDTSRYLKLQMIRRAGTPPTNSVWLVPRVIAIIVSISAFLAASATWVRERELRTLPLLVIARGGEWRSVFLGKLLLPVTAGLFLLVVSLLFTAALYRFGIKPGLAGTLVIQTLAILAVTFQGVIVSLLVASQFRAYLIAAAYLIALLLLTGLVSPVVDGSAAVRVISHLFPLTFAMPSLSGWLYFGILPSTFYPEMMWLVGQTVVFGLLSVVSFWHLHRQL